MTSEDSTAGGGGWRASVGEVDALLSEAAGMASRYIGGLDDRPVAPRAEAVAALEALGGELPDAPTPAAEVLRLLDRIGSPATVASAGPRYFGFVTGGAHPAGLAAAWLSSAWDQNVALRVMSPVGAALDDVALGWIAGLMGLPEGAGGGFTTGATMANATCLAAARDAVLEEAGWDSVGRGLAGGPRVTVAVGEEVHASALKALALVGLGRQPSIRLPVDDQGRIRAEDLPRLPRPAIVCLQAGNVNSGASDPFPPLIEWARREGAWVHVDGAFGLWAAASPTHADQVAGVQEADSWATDAHKWLNSTYDSGVALVRRPESLGASLEASAAYLQSAAGREPMHFSTQSSQRARGVEAWAILRALGRSGVADLVDRCCAGAARFAAGLRGAGFEVLNDVVLNQVVVAFGDADRTDRAVRAVQAEGTCWCGSTEWQGRRAMRVSVSNWSTTDEDVDRSVAAIARVVGSLD